MSNMRNNLPSRFVRRLGSRVTAPPSKPSIKYENVFSKDLMDTVTVEQREMLSSFAKKLNEGEQRFLKNDDFKHGTLRITQPGHYVLCENIVFNPTHQFPQEDQLELYPVGKNGPFHLGFFAAITIEAADVILDLNGYSITQSKRHNLLQRFFSTIELANSPFIPKQGPHAFSSTISSASNCLIMNGSLLNSSHHGIHGNLNTNIVLHNLEIHDFEVAAIALNGAKNAVIAETSCIGKNHDIQVLSSFSQALFTARALENLKDTDNSVYKTLDQDLQQAFREIMSGSDQTTFFKNATGQYDGNMYGIVLHVAGVIINDFLQERKPEHINDDITIYNVTIDDIETHPVEIVALPLSVQNKDNKIVPAYGGKQMVGVFGDVFDVEKNMDTERRYQPNVLSDAQLYMAEFHPGHGSTNIEKYVIDWSKNGSSLSKEQKFLPTGDSMGHIMKGNIGLFISGGKNIKLDNIVVDNVRTNGNQVGTSVLLKEDEQYFQGASSYGLLMTATNDGDVTLNEVRINNVSASQPKAVAKKIENL